MTIFFMTEAEMFHMPTREHHEVITYAIRGQYLCNDVPFFSSLTKTNTKVQQKNDICKLFINLVQISTKLRIRKPYNRNLVQISTKIRINICIIQKKLYLCTRFPIGGFCFLTLRVICANQTSETLTRENRIETISEQSRRQVPSK